MSDDIISLIREEAQRHLEDQVTILRVVYPEENSINRRIFEEIFNGLTASPLKTQGDYEEVISILQVVYHGEPKNTEIIELRLLKLSALYPRCYEAYQCIADLAYSVNVAAQKEEIPIGRSYHDFELVKKLRPA